MAMLSLPRAQIGLIENAAAGYIKNKMEHVLTRVPLLDNYFWRIYATRLNVAPAIYCQSTSTNFRPALRALKRTA